jgi:hypothetical protein
VSRVKRLVGAVGPLVLVAMGAAIFFAFTRTSEETRRRIKSAAGGAFVGLAEMLAAYERVRADFARLAPATPSWEALPETNGSEEVLARACLHTLARSPQPHRSAAELTKSLPFLTVPQGEAKVRKVLRTHDVFVEVWPGRWQVGEPSPALIRCLERRGQPTAPSDTCR